MATKKLVRLGFDANILQSFQNKNIYTCKDVLSRTEIELMLLLDLPLPLIKDIIQKVSAAVLPSASTVYDILQRRKETTFEYLPTTLPPLDKYLYGGLPSGSITEIVGPAGIGKSQFCLMMTLLATLPREWSGLDGSVVYFDTETSFSATRLVEMALSKFPDYFTEDMISLMVSRVNIYNLTSSTDIVEKLSSLEETIIEKNVKLIVLDSVASVVRKEFDGINVAKRQDLLSKEASMLKYLAETFHIPVLVSNQVTTKSEKFGFLPEKVAAAQANEEEKQHSASYVTPALGTLWAHCVNTRLVMDSMGTYRRLTIAKSPMSPVVSMKYHVTASGIELFGDNEEDIVQRNPENFWELKIIGRHNEVRSASSMDNQHHINIMKQQELFHYPTSSGVGQVPVVLKPKEQ